MCSRYLSHAGDFYSRHPDCHGGRSNPIKDILDKVITRLHLRCRLVVGYLVREYCAQELEELGAALNRVGNLIDGA